MIQLQALALTRLLTVLSMAMALSACVMEKTIEVPTSRQSETENGTGDSGGGNTYKGRPLEAYIQDPLASEAYQKVLQTRLQVIESIDPELARLFHSVLQKKVWYFVPGSLSALPPEKIGSAVATDQVALQDFESVWIDQDLLGKMATEDQAQLFLHEVLMGVKLLKFQPRKSQCLALAIKRDLCDWELTDAAKPISLLPQDYSDIRRVTSKLFHILESPLLKEDIEHLLATGGFSFRLKTFFPKKDPSILTSMTVSEIEASLLNSYHAGDFSRSWYGYHDSDLKLQNPNTDFSKGIPPGTLWKSSRACSVGRVFASSRDSFSLTVLPISQRSDESFDRAEMIIKESRPEQRSGMVYFAQNFLNEEVPVPSLFISIVRANASKPTAGDRSLDVSLIIRDHRVLGFEVRELTLLDSGHWGAGFVDKCGLKSEVQF